MFDMRQLIKETLKEQLNNQLVTDWTNKIIEALTAHYGLSKNTSHLYKLISVVVSKALAAHSFQSFNDFIGLHNPEFHQTNKNGNLRNTWWAILAYLLNVTDKLEKDKIDEEFMSYVISVMDDAVNPD